jgi:ATP-dependent helicase/nuclease subunit A
MHVPETDSMRDAYMKAQTAEYWRKLYVGMTRAEDELYVTGTLTKMGKPEGTWFEAIEQKLKPDSEVIGDTLVFPLERPDPAPAREAAEDAEASRPLVLDALPAHRPVETIRPSSAYAPSDTERAYETAAESAQDAAGARRRGIALHALLQHLGRVPQADREAVAGKAAAALLADDTAESQAEVARKALAIIAAPEHDWIFGPDSRAEVPFLVNAHRRGTPVRLVGRIDRLVVEPNRVRIVDFKSDAAAPISEASVPPGYVTQLGLYALVATQLFPGRSVEAAILWSSPEMLMFLPRKVLLEAAEGFTVP